MTKNEIRRLISSKIKGFGHMVDDTILAKILNGIIDLIPGDFPVASADTLGGVKVGDGLKINSSGVLTTDTVKKITIELSENVDSHIVLMTIRAIHKDGTAEVLFQQPAAEQEYIEYTFPEALLPILSTQGAVIVYSNTMKTEDSQIQLGYLQNTTKAGSHIDTSCLDANSDWLIPIYTNLWLVPNYTTQLTTATLQFAVDDWTAYV